MQLETYISDLLYRYDCVTVPEFGAFLTERVSAKVHETTNSFYPPKKVLSFNEQLQHNDGLLSSYIAEIEKIPYEVAVKKLAKHVKSVKSYLIQGETLTFNNIGEMLLNTEGKIVFTPSYHVNYLTDAFGLSQFVSQNIAREVYKENVEALEEAIPVAITPEKRASTSSATIWAGSTTKRPYLKYAAVALIALTIGGFTASNYYVNKVDAHNQIAQEEANEQLDAKVQEATFIISSPLPAATLSVEKQSGNYHIVAGAFRVEKNSDKKVQQLKDKGYNARKIGVNKYGLHEVVYSSYVDRIEALRALRQIKRTHNADAWLLVKALN
ncbi:HU domain-containing protein [Ichthyenterobacterium magnum]|uniref:Sporulation related protein n=1 Tax=Ichthyenterobacterium magnum TaxID=1230530 RepID=A0A420DXF2_9FLAO|nr:SPOR domain-containing protein [Ichthyenterobacterium magnum]RKE98877.1 sporulation related protein [Ichthyenterobacterium magnum]